MAVSPLVAGALLVSVNVVLLRQRIRTLWELPVVEGDTLTLTCYLFHYICADIIGCLVAGVILTLFFFLWNAYLSRVHARGSSTAWWQPPPLIPGGLWLRANGRFLAILMIVFWTWCSFLSNNFWVRVFPPCNSFNSATELARPTYVGLNSGIFRFR